MKTILKQLATLSFLLVLLPIHANDDPYLWLENVEGDKQLSWVKNKNKKALKTFKAHPKFETLKNNVLSLYKDKDRIPSVNKQGDYYYNFWKDDTHVRGLYRRTTLTEYKKDNPKWETVLDIDALSKEEGVNWVYKGMSCYYPAYKRCLVSLSRGGADATQVREFNLVDKHFVKDGFFLAEAKNSVGWYNADTIWVATDFNDGESMTDSGYPRQVKLWQRGTSLEQAKLLFKGNQSSVTIGGFTARDGENKHHFIYESESFYTQTLYLYDQGIKTKLPMPADASLKGIYKGNIFIELKSNWELTDKTYTQGSVVYTNFSDFINNKFELKTFVQPSDTASIDNFAMTKSYIIINWLDNVKNKLVRYSLDKTGTWQQEAFDFPTSGSISAYNINTESDSFFASYTDFLTPSGVNEVNAESLNINLLKTKKAKFDTSKFKFEQFMATSKDGTKVPYFVVSHKNLKNNGKNPTLLYGYGGFEVSLTPFYSESVGLNWLEQGGVYVLSNIRGGGEYGPKWHQAALKENRQRAYEDFEAIAEDLIAKKITSSKYLGIQGGSNGGLLVAAAFTRRPDLYNAVICQVPLLDMKRFNKLLAGASWMGEYGNPDIESEWKYIKEYSPYQNVKRDQAYPKVLFTSSTRDDRVHPAHARKMVAKMENMGYDVLYYENIEGGHAGAADINQSAEIAAMNYIYLLQQLSDK
ncbi:prolyl oligopeptidase family serine peptidase [Thalassotalea profundi]|uniref:Prolyl oligopeptidase n=1 Tax=Thalassotalea profundi TaxID=2036687 RepID=A0ABQ3IE65_9GAMM|nr:prolyl oligopeptidase family serine peptidase [Thalassotalea profundi]GHE81203.1 prolyl oligopeptidase [Thalassotalea profundi]